MIRFKFDGDDHVFTAHGRGDYWNGWLSPIVGRDTLTAVIDRMNARDEADGDWRTDLRWDGDDAVIRQVDLHTGDEEWELTINPDADGHYLLDMGLTVAQVD
ncbi:Uncharacterised protein [Mycobacteroides abscessus subsp. abscessus]|uniref:hypothetical protein n=1 Tax=Mycobacteroides abscessus TaxID=36809 RepID=UPI0009A5CBF2|nr:hypothetical protein [Mycobacteroides abscessus]SLJ23059.1 Uncharacterised protein [Mycobacteroides abscessus subsp. abscessus]